jgi:hypothetical protein
MRSDTTVDKLGVLRASATVQRQQVWQGMTDTLGATVPLVLKYLTHAAYQSCCLLNKVTSALLQQPLCADHKSTWPRCKGTK